MEKKICSISTIEQTMESFVIPAMRVFQERGYDVTLVCTMTDSFIEKYASEFHCVNIKMTRGVSVKDIFTKPLEFFNLFRREKFDYVQYATTNASFYACIPAWLCGIKTRVYCQWGLLYVGFTGLKRIFYKLIEQTLCAFATHVTVASKKNMEYAVAEGVMSRKKSSVIGDGGTIGVDLKTFDVSKRELYREQVLQEYPQLNGKIVYGFVGRIETDKGIQELLRAFLKNNMPDTALLLIGAFDELRSNISPALLSECKNKENIIFHGFTKEVPKYMAAMDILVHPTYREGFSMVIQQAMAMGCAIITTDVPGPSEVIEGGVSGLLVPDHAVDELAESMRKLKDDEGLRRQFVAAGLVRVREKFERQHMLELTFENRVKMMNREI